jgi:hypothetical protein
MDEGDIEYLISELLYTTNTIDMIRLTEFYEIDEHTLEQLQVLNVRRNMAIERLMEM